MKIVADAQIPYIAKYFASYGELVLKDGREISADDVRDAVILIVRSITKVGPALLKDSSVKFVGSVTAGADHLDTDWLDAAGITWSVASGFNAPPVADYVVSVVAALQQQQMLLQAKPRAAVIGVGNVGRLVVRNLKRLGFDVIQSDPIRAAQEKDFQSVDLNEIADCDFISLHVPLTFQGPHATHRFIDKAFLQRQKVGAVLLNASRGSVLNTPELLTNGNHLQICLDVWEDEPHIDTELLQAVTLATPHIAGYSVQSKIRGIDMIYQIACAHHFIEPLPYEPNICADRLLQVQELNWRHVVLEIFNPLDMTKQMRDQLLPAKNPGAMFDEMRNQFKHRYEFSAIQIKADHFDVATLKLLEDLGMKIKKP